jgi:esterase/lipase superfamily enzyme
MSYWMITNRSVTRDGFGADRAGEVTYWTADGSRDVTDRSSWTERSLPEFKRALLAAVADFRSPTPEGLHEHQRHVALLIHGYNNDWKGAASFYQTFDEELFAGDRGLGLCILFSWPSKGSPADYLPDRQDAVETAGDLADVLSEFYDWLSVLQVQAAKNPHTACRAKTSVIAHSMGNYVLQKAAKVVWTRKNEPLLVSLINQLVMVAADVDNDLFKCGENVDRSDGDALANLSYRITALYSGLDQVLGLSAGLKHFGKRRLGRSGLDPFVLNPDNVWDIDCTSLFRADHIGGFDAHRAYFREPATLELMRRILQGVDRNLIQGGVEAQTTSWPARLRWKRLHRPPLLPERHR